MAEAVAKSAKDSNLESQATNWTAKPILDPELTEEIELQDVYVGLLEEKRNISVAIQSIASILPGFNHLKRCSANRLLLTPLNSPELIKEIRGTYEEGDVLSHDELKNILKSRGFDLNLLEDNLIVKRVPRKCPKTKKQAAAASAVWPVNFHPNPAIESVIDGSVFDEKQLRLIEKYMSVAIAAARYEAIGNKDCTGSAVIADPEDGRILAVAASRIHRHPMWHAAMLAVDLVAKLQGGGAWNLQEDYPNVDSSNMHSKNDVNSIVQKCNELETSNCGNNSICKFVNSESQSCDETVEMQKKLSGNSKANVDEGSVSRQQTIKRKYEESTPLFYPPSLSAITLPSQEPLVQKTKHRGRRNNGTTKCVDINIEPKNSTDKCGPYLCTGYWVFLLKEPCPLCAMCLLHSRVARIFYGAENKSAGVLGSRAVLHSIPGLNHRYNVWSGILEETCRKVLKEIDLKNID